MYSAEEDDEEIDGDVVLVCGRKESK